MMPAILFTAAAAVAVCLLAFFVVRGRLKSRRLRSIEASLATDPLEAASLGPGRPVLARAVATRVSARCENLELLTAPTELRVAVTEDGLTAEGPSGWHLPHARVVDAVFVARQGRWASGTDGALLKVTWRQAGRSVTTVLLVHGDRREGEKLRKELHLRAGSARPFGSR